MLLHESYAGAVCDLVPDEHEDKRPSAALLEADVCDGGCAPHRFTDPDRMVKGEATAGPHPTRQRHRRQEAAALSMAVRSNLRLLMQWKKVKPMPQWRQYGARARLRLVAIEGRWEGSNRNRRNEVL